MVGRRRADENTIDFRRLVPHESVTTDVILVGHSLGGILGAEVVLLPPDSSSGQQLFHRRILGLIAFDTPFLGMHPGVVGTGIASIFRSPQPKSSAVEEHPLQPLSTDPDPFTIPSDSAYNPAYANDHRLASRKGTLERAWYFWNKHYGGLAKATQSYVTSHLEFGGCLADYAGLQRRYNAIRALEDVDESASPRAPNGHLMRRVRFVNYYSVSTGPIQEWQEVDTQSKPSGIKEHSLGHYPSSVSSDVARPRWPLEAYRDSNKDLNDLKLDPDLPAVGQESSDTDIAETSVSPASVSPVLTSSTPISPVPTLPAPTSPASILSPPPILPASISPVPTLAAPTSAPTSAPTLSAPSTQSEDALSTPTLALDGIPPLPPVPTKPLPLNLSSFNDKDAKLATKEHERQLKEYDRAMRNREKCIREREKAARLSRNHQLKRSSALDHEAFNQPSSSSSRPLTTKKRRDRKFCALPRIDPTTGRRDPTWIRVFMEDMDEVVAHTSMFAMSDTYAKLVGDTAARIEDWIREDASREDASKATLGS